MLQQGLSDNLHMSKKKRPYWTTGLLLTLGKSQPSSKANYFSFNKN